MRHFGAESGCPDSTRVRALLAIGLLNLVGCAGPRNHAWGPPTTVPEPQFTVGAPPRRAAMKPIDPLPPPPDSMPERTNQRSASRFTNWLRSGRGVTWGAARKGPIRDEGLDRMMADTLMSGSPGHVQEPSARAPAADDDDAWMFPSDDSADLRRPAVPARSTASTRVPPTDDSESVDLDQPFPETTPAAPLPRRSPRTISLPSRSSGWRSVDN